MVRKAELITNEDIQDVDYWAVDENPTDTKTSQKKKFDDLLDDLNSDENESATVHLYRQPNGGRDAMIFLESMPADKYTLDGLLMYLKSNYGGGDYRLMIRSNGKLRANKLVSIEATKPQAQTNQSGDMGDILRAVLDQQEKTQQMLLHIAQNNQRPQIDGGDQEMKFLEKMAIYKQLFGSEQKSGGLGEIQNALNFVKELGIDVGVNRGGDNEPSMLDVLDRATPLFTALLDQKQQPQAAPQPAQPKPQPTAEQMANLKKSKEQQQMNLMLKMGLKTLIRAASHNSDPATYADLILDQFGEAQAAQLLSTPDAMQKLMTVEPAALQYKQWFDDLSEHVKAQIGLPSKYADLYGDELTIDPENDTQEENLTGTDNATDVHTASAPQR